MRFVHLVHPLTMVCMAAAASTALCTSTAAAAALHTRARSCPPPRPPSLHLPHLRLLCSPLLATRGKITFDRVTHSRLCFSQWGGKSARPSPGRRGGCDTSHCQLYRTAPPPQTRRRVRATAGACESLWTSARATARRTAAALQQLHAHHRSHWFNTATIAISSSAGTTVVDSLGQCVQPSCRHNRQYLVLDSCQHARLR
jgi:hypothetical protein